MGKFAVVGSGGYVGKNLIHCMENDHVMVGFSHSSKLEYVPAEFNVDLQYSLSSLILNLSEFDVIVFLLESKQSSDRIIIKEYFAALLSVLKNTKLVLFSTVSIYSEIKSEYVQFKIDLESIAQKYQNAYIFRPGVIYGGCPGGLYKRFLGMRKKSLLLLPCCNSITGFVDIKSISFKLNDILNFKFSEKVHILVDIPLRFSDAIRFFRFRGYAFQIPSSLIQFIFSPFTFFLHYFPSSVQSIVVLSAIQLPNEILNLAKGIPVPRRILLNQLAGSGMPLEINFTIRKFIREFEVNNSYFQYLNMTISQRFIFFKRLYEIYKLSINNGH